MALSPDLRVPMCSPIQEVTELQGRPTKAEFEAANMLLATQSKELEQVSICFTVT